MCVATQCCNSTTVLARFVGCMGTLLRVQVGWLCSFRGERVVCWPCGCRSACVVGSLRVWHGVCVVCWLQRLVGAFVFKPVDCACIVLCV